MPQMPVLHTLPFPCGFGARKAPSKQDLIHFPQSPTSNGQSHPATRFGLPKTAQVGRTGDTIRGILESTVAKNETKGYSIFDFIWLFLGVPRSHG
jgi:hypothetical protein